MKRKPTYDPRCYDLAELFLSDEPTMQHRTSELAATIQSVIEDWITCERIVQRTEEQQK